MIKKHKVISIILALAITVSIINISHALDKQSQESEITSLTSEIESLEAERDRLSDIVIKEKVDKELAKYVLTIEIKQVHYNLDIADHLKDSMNAITLQIPVDKEYYDELDIGDSIDESFRFGSLVMKGSFGSWKIKVVDKEVL